MALSKILNASVTDSTLTTTKLATPNLGRRNVLINGDMQVAQRGTSTTLAHDGTTDGYSPDRFRFTMGGTHEQLDGTVAQVADHPTSTNGKSLKWTTGTAESSYDADEYVYIVQKIEAQNLQHLEYGNSNAKAITISFYVKSSITGTYAFGLYKEDSTTRIFNKTYTIDSANTWEKKTLTFFGDTDSGAGIVNDNGTGLYVSWHLSAGTNIKGGGSVGAWKNYSGLTDWADGQATNAIMTTASATFQITECQLEVNSQATPFEHRSFGEELALCQRYLQKYTGVTAIKTFPHTSTLHSWNDNNASNGMVSTTTTMRAAPTITESGLRLRSNNHGNFDGTFAFESITVDGAHTAVSGASGLNTGRFYNISSTNTSSYIQLDAEL
jgi:hypothetical protein